MKQVLKTGIVFLIVLLFLLPSTIAIESGSTDSEKEIDQIPRSLEPKKTESIFKISTSHNEAYLTYSPSKVTRTRADDDLAIDLESTPLFTDLSSAEWKLLYADNEDNIAYAWGVKNQQITYTPVIVNTGSTQINSFVLRLVVHEAIANPNGEGWILGEEIENIKISLGPLPAGTNSTQVQLDARLSWKPRFAGRIRVLIKTEHNNDPDTSNNIVAWWPYIMQVYNTVETLNEQDEWEVGNGWNPVQLEAHEDPNPDTHSAPTVWESDTLDVDYLILAIDLSNCKDGELPILGTDTSWGTRGIFLAWHFSSSAPLSTWAVECWNSTSQSWDNRIFDADNYQDGWYSMGFGNPDEDGYRFYGSFLDQHYCTKYFKIRFTGNNLYVDDPWVVSLEYLVPHPPPEPILSFDVDFHADDDYEDQNGNSIKDQTFYPGNEYSWNFTLTNTAPTDKTGKGDPFGATIETTTFAVKEKPDDWNIVFAPSSISTEIAPGELINFTMTVDIPNDAKASAYYKQENNDWNPFFIEFGTTALPVNTDPGAIPPSLMRNTTVETLVHELPDIDVSVTSATNISGKTGSEIEYIISVVNVGNCNNSITVRGIKPSGFVDSIDIDERDFDLEVGEEKSVAVTVYIPTLINAGSYPFEVTIETAEIEYEYMSGETPIITKTVNLMATVEQDFGLLLDLKDDSHEQIEVDTAKAGSMVQLIDFEVANNGNGRDIAKFVVEANNNDDNDWYDLGGTDTVELGPVGGDDKKDFSIEFKVPEDAPHGEHMFTVKATSQNDSNVEKASVEKNITFTVLRPDLEVSADIDLNPASPLKGEATLISVKVYNNGTTSASDFSVNLYIDDELVDFRPVNGLAKGENTDLTPFEYVFEVNKEYDIKVLVNPMDGIKDKGNVTEIDELNNEVTRTVEVIAPELQFDSELVVNTGDGVEIEPQGEDRYDVMKDETYKFGVTVMNKGKADAKAVRVNLKVFYRDPMDDEIQVYEKNITLPSISAGGSKAAEFTWVPELFGTDYYITFSVDPENKISEENENNNLFDPEENFRSEPEPVEVPDEMKVTTIIGVIVAVVIIGAIVAVLVVMFRRKK